LRQARIGDSGWIRWQRALSAIKEVLKKRHQPSLRALKPLAARPKAVAGSNPAVCFSGHFWIATSLRSSQ
jgi:hypothetical protein